MATQTQTPAPPPSYTSGPGSVQAGRPTTQAEINAINSQSPGLYTYQQPTTPSPSGVTSTSPVITSNMAQKDYADKLKNFQNLQAQISQQKSLMAQQAAQRATDDAQKELQKSEQTLREQQLGIQQQQADTAQADAEAKRQALSMSSYSTSTSTTSPSTTPPTPAPTVPPAVVPDPTQAGLNSAVDQKLTGLSDIQTARDAITQQSNQALQSLLNGSIPLTPSQQTLVGSLQAQLALNVADQKQANASYTGAVTTAGFRAGGEYTAEQYAGNIHAAVSLGVLKIQRLDNEAAKTIAELEQSFQKGNYDIINKQYDNLTKSLDEKAATLKDTYDTVTKALQDQRDYNYKVTQDEFDNKLKVATFNETVKKNALEATKTRLEIAKMDKLDTQVIELPNKNKALINSQNGEIIKTFGADETPGDVKQLSAAETSINDVSGLITDSYLNTAVGPNAWARISFKDPFTGGRVNFIAGVEKLRSQLNLDALIDAKAKGATFGALSDQELQVLSSSATKIGTWAIKDKDGTIVGYKASEADFKKELQKINNAAKLDYVLKGGNPATVNIQIMGDGTMWTLNDDGTLTKIR